MRDGERGGRKKKVAGIKVGAIIGRSVAISRIVGVTGIGGESSRGGLILREGGRSTSQ